MIFLVYLFFNNIGVMYGYNFWFGGVSNCFGVFSVVKRMDSFGICNVIYILYYIFWCCYYMYNYF